MKHAFTMAEILLSLTIIGVVAAITLPSLTGNINERTWNTQRKALYARFSQALALMPSLNGYGTFIEGDDSTSAVDTTAETLITDGLAKVLKINNICDHEHLQDCGIKSSIITMNNSQIPIPKTLSELNSDMIKPKNAVAKQVKKDTTAVAFETQNGESLVLYYNPDCISEIANVTTYKQRTICANLIYDLNGTKGPNTVSKDIGFITVIYPTDPIVVAPMPLANDILENKAWNKAVSACKALDNESRLPNLEEVISMFCNRSVIGNLDAEGYWSSRRDIEPTQVAQGSHRLAWVMTTNGASSGYARRDGIWNPMRIRCVKR